MDLAGMGSTAMHDSKAYSIGKYERSKLKTFCLNIHINSPGIYRSKIRQSKNCNKCSWARCS